MEYGGPQMLPVRHALASAEIPRHSHPQPYAALVLAGGYEEAGEAGRFRVSAGDVLVHAAFASHLDRAVDRRTVVLNLPLPLLWARSSMRGRTEAVDELARLAERDVAAAGELLRAALRPGARALAEPPDALATALSAAEGATVGAWADAQAVARTTAWRWFRGLYGVAPARFRVEARARRAWWRIVGSDEPLATIAGATGFADQAHMGREVRALTGRTPGAWRRMAVQHSFKTTAR